MQNGRGKLLQPPHRDGSDGMTGPLAPGLPKNRDHHLQTVESMQYYYIFSINVIIKNVIFN